MGSMDDFWDVEIRIFEKKAKKAVKRLLDGFEDVEEAIEDTEKASKKAEKTSVSWFKKLGKGLKSFAKMDLAKTLKLDLLMDQLRTIKSEGILGELTEEGQQVFETAMDAGKKAGMTYVQQIGLITKASGAAMKSGGLDATVFADVLDTVSEHGIKAEDTFVRITAKASRMGYMFGKEVGPQVANMASTLLQQGSVSIDTIEKVMDRMEVAGYHTSGVKGAFQDFNEILEDNTESFALFEGKIKVGAIALAQLFSFTAAGTSAEKSGFMTQIFESMTADSDRAALKLTGMTKAQLDSAVASQNLGGILEGVHVQMDKARKRNDLYFESIGAGKELIASFGVNWKDTAVNMRAGLKVLDGTEKQLKDMSKFHGFFENLLAKPKFWLQTNESLSKVRATLTDVGPAATTAWLGFSGFIEVADNTGDVLGRLGGDKGVLGGVQAVLGGMSKPLTGAVKGMSKLGKLAGGGLLKGIGALQPLLLTTSVKLYGVATAGWAAVAPFLPFIITLGAIGTVFYLLETRLGIFSKAWERLTDLFSDFDIKEFVGGWIGSFMAFPDKMMSILGGWVGSVKDLFGGVKDIIVGIFTGDFGVIKKGLFGVIKSVLWPVKLILQGFSGMLHGFVDSGILNRLGMHGMGGFLKSMAGQSSSMASDISMIGVPTGIPAAAEGAIVSSPKLVAVGEGGEDEAIIPLSKRKLQQYGIGESVDTSTMEELLAKIVLEIRKLQSKGGGSFGSFAKG